MKAFNIYNQEPTGSLPPQLFKYIDIKNIETDVSLEQNKHIQEFLKDYDSNKFKI